MGYENQMLKNGARVINVVIKEQCAGYSDEVLGKAVLTFLRNECQGNLKSLCQEIQKSIIPIPTPEPLLPPLKNKTKGK